jgi:hypothetical protein
LIVVVKAGRNHSLKEGSMILSSISFPLLELAF